MKYTTKKLDNAQIEFTITITPDEYAPELKAAAKHIAEHKKIKGFRKGKAPYEIIKKEIGEMGILQEALTSIIQKTFFDAVQKEKAETVGNPEISVEKVAPQNDLVYTAKVALLPEITIADPSKIKAKFAVKKITEEKITKSIDQLRNMQATEVIVNEAATKDDKVVIDMDMLLDKVPVEGGQSKDYQVYLSENHYVPGFNEELIGLKKDDKKEFVLTFPKNHYQKMLAGNIVSFKITVKNVYKRTLPKLDENFAKHLGQKTVKELKERVKDNLENEEKKRANQEYEITILEELIDKSKFTKIPDILIDAERHKILHELKQDLEKNGITIEQYLEDIKKSEKDLFEEFRTQAERRAKAALLSRAIAIQEKLAPKPDEIEQELQLLRDTYQTNPEHLEKIKTPEVHNSIASLVQNRKVMKWLKDGIKTEKKK